MIKYAIIFVFILMLAHTVQGASININIAEELNGELKVILEAENNVVSFTNDMNNVGSVSYYARSRIDVFNEDNIIFTGWGNQHLIVPGEIKASELYWYASNTTNITARTRMYYGGEVIEKMIDLPDSIDSDTEDVFKIRAVRTFDNKIRFFVKANQEVSDVIVMPHNYPPGWIIEQASIGSVNDAFKEVNLYYEFPELVEMDIDLIIVSNDGKYYSNERITVREQSGVPLYIGFILDFFDVKLSSVLG